MDEGAEMHALSRLVTIGLFVALVAAVAAWATSQTLTLSDPAGDTADLNTSTITPPYMDMVGASVSKKGPVFEFSMTLAAPIPDQPALPAQTKEIWWLWALDTDRTTFPAGYPRAPGVQLPPEFDVVVAWDGSRFSAYLDDRRPLLTGDQNVFTPIGFTRKGTKVTATVEAASLGDPQRFGVRVLTAIRLTSQAAEGFAFADLLPDTNLTFVEWPPS